MATKPTVNQAYATRPPDLRNRESQYCRENVILWYKDKNTWWTHLTM